MINVAMLSNELNNKKKAAAIIISLGTDYAAQIYKHLREEEIEQLSTEIAVLQKLTSEEVEKILNEFYELCLAQKFITEGGIEYAKGILDKAIGAQKSSILIDKISKSLKAKAFSFLRKADPKHLMTFIQNEHPQTIALILSYARPEQSAAILTDLPKEIQVDVVKRIAAMDRTSPEIIKEVERTLEKKFSTIVSVDFTEIGGINYMAEILNSVDRATEKYILEELSKKEPTLTEEIRKRMFVFEDIVSLDPKAIQRILSEVDTKDLNISLKGSSEEVIEIFHSNMSTRMSEIMREEAQYLGGVRLHEVEEAQQRLVSIVRRLEEAGEIYIVRGGKDEMIV